MKLDEDLILAEEFIYPTSRSVLSIRSVPVFSFSFTIDMMVFIGHRLARQVSYIMNCHCATPSIWGNLTGMCVSSNADVQSSWDNVKTSKNPTWTIC